MIPPIEFNNGPDLIVLEVKEDGTAELSICDGYAKDGTVRLTKEQAKKIADWMMAYVNADAK